MTQSTDLDAYLERVGWTGALAPDYATLAGLLDAHMARIPFENLDVLLGRGVRLDLDSLQRKLVHERRGGYCFEHGTLLAAVLERLGFRVERFTARVVLFLPAEQMPRTHMFLVVHLPSGSYVVDPGFGTLAPRVPVALVPDVPVTVRAETHWMTRANDRWTLHTRNAEKSQSCWVSDLDRDYDADFELGNWYTSTHPSSGFVNRLTLRALTASGRVTVMNRDVTITDGSECATHRLADRAALRALIAAHFGFDLPEIERMRVPSIPEWT